jgi:hypothetical protein
VTDSRIDRAVAGISSLTEGGICSRKLGSSSLMRSRPTVLVPAAARAGWSARR